MSLEHLALAETDNFPIRHEGKVHNGKVRSVYWLDQYDSNRIIKQRNYPVDTDAPLGVMIISDRISAFDCNWQGEDGLRGVPSKGAALNAISNYWFEKFDARGLSTSHILENPHPLVWIVQHAEPIMIEAIARKYITGSMWRAYSNGEREFCGIKLPNGLQENQQLDKLLITPSTKGILRGIPGIPEEDDVNITRKQILDSYKALGFKMPEDIGRYELLLAEGFLMASTELINKGQLLVDTKFEFGYVPDGNGNPVMMFIDEALTPDSSRYWDGREYQKGKVIENSKEGFCQFLLSHYDKDVLLDKKRMPERKELAKNTFIPVDEMMKISATYTAMAELITGKEIKKIENPRQEIFDALSSFKIME